MTTETLDPPRLDIGPIVKISELELRALYQMCDRKDHEWPTFTGWVKHLIHEELARRASDGAIEPKMADVPTLNGFTAAECLKASFVFSRYGLTKQQGEFIDHLAMHILAVAVAGLQLVVGDTEL